jgi:DNA-binding NarL/FixJ family response regulator
MEAIDFENSVKMLTKKEKVIVKLIIQGNSSKEIAEILYNSRRTIETHRQNIAAKFDKYGQGKLFLFLLENKNKIINSLERLENFALQNKVA